MYIDGTKWAIEKGCSTEVINNIIAADKYYALNMSIVLSILIICITICVLFMLGLFFRQ